MLLLVFRSQSNWNNIIIITSKSEWEGETQTESKRSVCCVLCLWPFLTVRCIIWFYHSIVFSRTFTGFSVYLFLRIFFWQLGAQHTLSIEFEHNAFNGIREFTIQTSKSFSAFYFLFFFFFYSLSVRNNVRIVYTSTRRHSMLLMIIAYFVFHFFFSRALCLSRCSMNIQKQLYIQSMYKWISKHAGK